MTVTPQPLCVMSLTVQCSGACIAPQSNLHELSSSSLWQSHGRRASNGPSTGFYRSAGTPADPSVSSDCRPMGCHVVGGKGGDLCVCVCVCVCIMEEEVSGLLSPVCRRCTTLGPIDRFPWLTLCRGAAWYIDWWHAGRADQQGGGGKWLGDK